MSRIWLIIILCVAIFFRFFHLTSSPAALNWDEVSIGYNAYSILKTGRDEWGQLMPLSFKAFGEQKLPAMIYVSIPAIAIFGLNDFSVRLTPAIIGLVCIFGLYLLTKKLYGEKIALIAASIMAVSPWAVHFSRISFEAGLAMCFLIFGVYYAIPPTKSSSNYWLSLCFVVLAAYSYNSIRILLPLLFVAYWYLKVFDRKKIFKVMLVGAILLIPIFSSLSSKEGRVRWGTVSISNQKSFLDDIASSRGYTHLPDPLPRIIHNKFTHYAYDLTFNYLHMFSTEFLFFSGGTNTQRSTQGLGLLYLFEFPLLIIGIIKAIQTKEKILIPWLLLAPIPSILTIDSPSTVRALNMLPPLLILEGLGAVMLYEYLNKQKILKVLYLSLIIWNISYFAYQLWHVYPVKFADKWQYGYKQAVGFAQSHYQEASKIYLTAGYGEPYIFTLFYTQYDPHKFQTEKVDKEVDPTGWVHVSGFDKYRFTNFSGLEEPKEIVARGSGKQVLVTSFAQLPGEYHRDFAVQAPNWRVMFEGTVQEGMQ